MIGVIGGMIRDYRDAIEMIGMIRDYREMRLRHARSIVNTCTGMFGRVYLSLIHI